MPHSTRLFEALSRSPAKDKDLLRSRLPWYYDRGIQMDPPFAHFLDDHEIQQCADWFTLTTDDPFIGDSGFIAISFIVDLILANQLKQVVQLGHYAGFGSMLLGMVLRKVSPDARLVSFDIDSRMNEFCDRLMDRTGLSDTVLHACMDSTDPTSLEVAGWHLRDSPQLIFIDASKQYQNTITEMEMWTPHINGYVIAHDVSLVAKGGQANGSLGVCDGLVDSKVFGAHELLILDPATQTQTPIPYLDPCGLGVGISRGTKPLPKPSRPLDQLLAARRILEPAKLESAENWFFEGPFSYRSGRVLKQSGSAGWATCFAPIHPHQRLGCEVTIRSSRGSEALVCAGGPPGSTFVFSGSGMHRGEFIAGAENALVGIYGDPESEFEVERLRIFPIE